MTDLEKIEQFLDIDTDDKRLRNGKKKNNKNQYFYYKDQFYIVKLTQEKWMVCSDDDTTRKLLRNHTWYAHSNGYAVTDTKRNGIRATKLFHRLVIEAQDKSDHINRNTFDNRATNLRDVTSRQNMRNKTKHKNNTSGKQGIYRYVTRGYNYWMAYIYDNEGNRIYKSFSIKQYGEEEAKQKAIEQRLAWEQLYGYIGD